MKTTIERLRTILEEQFGPDRVAVLENDATPWTAQIEPKAIDLVDFRLFVEEEFGIYLPDAIAPFNVSLDYIAGYLDAVTPSTSAH